MNIVHTLTQGPVTRRAVVTLEQFDAALVIAIEDAKEAGVPQGLIVALLQGHAHQETAWMMSHAQ